MTRFIGDVHGKWKQYKSLIKSANESIQVGDLGVGFRSSTKLDEEGLPKHLSNPPYDTMTKYNAKFIRGNHDNPSVCKNHTQWISDGYFDEQRSIFYVGGALSIDKNHRIDGLDWWHDEELDYSVFYELTYKIEAVKPRIVVTHDCPESIKQELFSNHIKRDIPSRTNQGLQALYDTHKPELWIFGHYHISKNKMISSTRFICLAELEYIDIDLT